MATLLHLDSSPMGTASVSRHLSQTFVEHWKQANPDGKVVTRDLTKSGLTSINAEWVAAAYTPADKRTEEQKQVLALSDELVKELQEADEYAIGVPMHNFGVASVFKQWIDQVVRAGVTFRYVDGAPKGLLQDKKATILIAAAGVYGPGTATASLNFVEPYLKVVFGFIGVTDVTFHTADGAAALNYGTDRAVFLQPHEEAVRALAGKGLAVAAG
jgi:FMN-dependent NADH-azoreductase